LIEEEREETTEAKNETEESKKEIKLDKKEEKLLIESIDELKTLHLQGMYMCMHICTGDKITSLKIINIYIYIYIYM
jgi:hypothetical protein